MNNNNTTTNTTATANVDIVNNAATAAIATAGPGAPMVDGMLQDELHERISRGESVLAEMNAHLNEACQYYADQKSRNARFFPKEEVLASAQNLGTSMFKMLSIQEMPCLVSIGEKAMEPHGQVFHNVKEFVARLELHFNLHQVDINAVHHRYIPLLTGRTYQMYLSTKTQEVQAGMTITWEMVKIWLMEYANTPKQRAENLRALVQIKPCEDENTESFSTQLWSLLDSVDPENLTISEMLLTLLLDSVPPSWKSKLLANINASSTAVSKLDYKSIVRLIADLHLGPE
ncbi:hypothetical protein DFQ29_003275, partial [Apophysomyces sp. BC1021]